MDLETGRYEEGGRGRQVDQDLTRKSTSGPFPRPHDLGFGQDQSVRQEDTRWDHPYGEHREATSP